MSSRYNVVDFEDMIKVRIKAVDRKAINKVVSKSNDVYDNESHFVRCAIRRLLRDDCKKYKIRYGG